MTSNSSRPDGVAEPGRRRSRWTGDRLLFLAVGIVLCGYALVSLLLR